MSEHVHTADEIERGIVEALKAQDVIAAVQLLRYLAGVDPHRAQDVLDTMQLGLELAKAGDS